MNKAEEKGINWLQKLAYSADGLGGNFYFTFVSTYMLMFITDAAGLNAGIVGTLILISKIFDGVSDIYCGALIDRTHTRWGKARPWLIGSAVPLAITQVLLFMIPDATPFIQYAYFFIVYCAANVIFYTANSVAYNTLSALITQKVSDRVHLGSMNFLAGSIAGIIIPIIYTKTVSVFGGGTTGWRMTATIFALLQLVFCAITFIGTKELPLEDSNSEQDNQDDTSNNHNANFIATLKVVFTNRYYLTMLAIQFLIACIGPFFFTSGSYYCQWIMGNPMVLSSLSTAFSMGMLVGMIINPFFVSKFGYRKTMGWMNVVSVVMMIGFIAGAYLHNLPLLLVTMFLKNMTGFASVGCCMNAAIADIAKYVYRTSGIHCEGSMFSCCSMGQKLGQGITVSVCGWLLTLGGYVGTASVQSAGALNMITVMFAVIPLILTAILTIACFSLKIEEANKALDSND